jgi:transcriptional regulator with XRE-family HTH domain
MGAKDKQLAEAFAAKVRELRTAASITQAELGERAGMQPQAVARYEKGDRLPTLAILYQLAAALRCTPCDLLPEGKKGRPRR